MIAIRAVHAVPALRAVHALRAVPRGQVSLEYLLVLAAALSITLFLLAPLKAAYHASIFALDTKNASSFLNQLESSAEQLCILGEGTTRTLRAEPMTKWHLENNGNGISLTLECMELETTKTLTAELCLPAEGAFPASFENKFSLALEKENNFVSITNS